MSRPFRWDVRHREQLGTLLPSPSRLPDHMDELRLASARIVARAGDAELVFVGRSLENVFDYLGAVLAGTSWSERPRLLSISLWSTTVADLSAEQIDGFATTHARSASPRRRSSSAPTRPRSSTWWPPAARWKRSPACCCSGRATRVRMFVSSTIVSASWG
ncbi:MAG: hypothetical protein IPN32_15615 [Deltaproteobacteria bacterium]|nr:hypothetical protein [Deltaproteobacteria bacterium]